MEAVLQAENGRRLTLSSISGPEEDLSYLARLVTEAGQVERRVWEYKSELASFVRELADAWRGFDGVREYASIEGDLRLVCEYDGRGAVECEVRLRQMGPPGWSMSAVLTFGAGAHLEAIATAVERFFANED